MPDGLTVQPEFRAVGEIRRASSSCCGAKLNGTPEQWECRKCGRPCDRVLSEPEEVEFHG